MLCRYSDVNSIEAVNKFCCLNAISLILAWDNELGRYVETIGFENWNGSTIILTFSQ